MVDMNSTQKPISRRWRIRHKQDGVVLLIALIAVVLLLVAGLATLRSVDTTTMVTGNLAFREGSVQASDRGIEVARGTLMSATSTGSFFYSNALYGAIVENPVGSGTFVASNIPGQTCSGTGMQGYFPVWDDSFIAIPGANGAFSSKVSRCNSTTPVSWGSDSIAVSGAPTGYSVNYIVHRMCEHAGDYADPTTNCFVVNTQAVTGNSQAGGGYGDPISTATSSAAPYYRVTVRVVGPRNSVAYVQALVY